MSRSRVARRVGRAIVPVLRILIDYGVRVGNYFSLRRTCTLGVLRHRFGLHRYIGAKCDRGNRSNRYVGSIHLRQSFYRGSDQSSFTSGIHPSFNATAFIRVDAKGPSRLALNCIVPSCLRALCSTGAITGEGRGATLLVGRDP